MNAAKQPTTALAAVILGLLLPLLLGGLPSWWVSAAAGLFVLGLLFRGQQTRPLLFLLAAAYALVHFQWANDRRLPEDLPLAAHAGVVSSLPVPLGDGLEFEFLLLEPPWASAPRTVRVRWHRDAQPVEPGQAWILPLKLTTTRGRINFAGPDSELRAWIKGIHAYGSVTGSPVRQAARDRPYHWESQRSALRKMLLASSSGYAQGGLLLALGIGDRSALSIHLRDTLASTGTSHLLAISGLHVGLVSWMGFRLVLWCLIPVSGKLFISAWPGRRLAMIPALLLGSAYAMLAGFGTSPRRALLMLLVVAAVLILRRRVSPWCGWLVAMLLVLLLNPLAGAEAGFWLSFAAVAILLVAFTGFRPLHRGARGLWQAQLAITWLMLPLSIFIFAQFSPLGLLANLGAIPWVSIIVLPLVLLSMVSMTVDSALTEVIVAMALNSAAVLVLVLEFLTDHFDALVVPVAAPGRPTLLAASAGAALLLAPRALRLRLPGVLLVLTLFLPAIPALRSGEWSMDVLDVGQGSANLLRLPRGLVLIDTGPGITGGWNLLPSVISPALARYSGERLRAVVVSHGDLDHAGALEPLAGEHPGAAFMVSRRSSDPRFAPCDDRRDWVWAGVRLRVLHPTPWLPYQGNNSSCVLEVSGAGSAALLTGDIERAAEFRLPQLGTGDHDLLLVPHHGSRSSSSLPLLQWSNARYAVVSASANNRFGFPHPDVRQRHLKQGSQFSSTADCGGLHFLMQGTGQMTASSARRERNAIWRWPAGEDCP